jgi:tripartite-type tricarboxylate transporter receptor subunit TctC
VIERLNRELARAVFSPNVKKAFSDTAFVPMKSTPEQAVQTVERDVKIWGPLLSSLGIKPD